MRVAVFTDADLDAMNGTTSALRALLEHAPADVSLRIYSFAALEVDDPQYFAARTVGCYVDALQRLAGRARADGASVIHAASTGPAGLAGLALAARTGVPLVGSVHGPREPAQGAFSSARWWRSRYDRWFYSYCRALLVPSAGWNACTRGAEDDARCVVWRRGVDVNRFAVARRSIRRREEWHVSDKRPAILIMGPLCADRGLAIIEPLGSFLYQHRLAHRFIVAGDGPAAAELCRRCPDALFLGRVPAHELAEVYASADVLLRTAGHHGGCTSLLEAQASGIPVIVADAGNAHEHLRHERTGYVCRAGDVADCGARLAAVLRDPARLRDMGHAARAYALERTSTAALAPVYALYRGMTAARDGITPSFALPSVVRRAGR